MEETVPLNWQDYLDPSDADVPLHAFRHSIKKRMAMYLNEDVVVDVDELLCPDWGGLAELIGFDGREITDIGRNANPGREVIERWIDRLIFHPTVGNLVKHLASLGREDILTDFKEQMKGEIEFHRNRHEIFQKAEEQPVQDETVSSISEDKCSHILTIDDTLTTIAIYDAFVCYEAKDLAFVKEMIRRLEDPCYGFRFFVPGRNNLVGTNTYDLMTRIISERCRHMIVILSNNFIASDVCTFQRSYAFSLNPSARDKKMVPIKIDDCPIPETLRIMSCCDFTNEDVRDWSWNRLAGSIQRPMSNKEFMGPLTSNSHRHSHRQMSSSSSSSSSFLPLPSLNSQTPSSSKSDSGYISEFPSSQERSTIEATSLSQSQETSPCPSPSSSIESHLAVKSNMSKAFKRITSFASPKNRKKEKMEAN